MKIPKTVKVSGRKYTVLFPYVFIETDELQGQSDHRTNQIRLSKHFAGEERAQENIEETFIHELLHCIDSGYNNGKMDEDVLDRISKGIYAVLKDNGWLK